MMYFRSKLAIIWLILTIVTVGLFSIQTTEAKTGEVNIAYFPLNVCLPIFVAQEKGFFDEKNIGLKVNLIKIADPMVMDQTLISGSADAGWAGMYDILLFQMRTPGKFKLALSNLSTKDHPLDYMLVYEKPDQKIEKLSDLNGKIIGRTVGIFSKLTMELILKDEVDLSKTTLQEIPGSAMVQTLISGKVDALFVYEPLVTIALSQSDKIKILDKALICKKIVDPFPNAGFVLSSKFIKENPESAKKIVKALDDAVNYIRANEKEVKLIIPKYTALSEDLANKVGLVWCWKNGEIKLPVIQKLADKFRSPDGLTDRIDVSKIYYKVNYKNK